MEYNSETPFSRKIRVEREEPAPAKWSTPEEFSQLRQISFWLKREYNLRDAVNEPEPPHEDISSSYLKQMLRFELGGREYLLAGREHNLDDWPTPMEAEDPRRAAVLAQIQGYWMSAWHPGGYPTPIASLAERDLTLQSAVNLLRLINPELRVTPATAVQAQGSWVEGGAIVGAIPESAVTRMAKRLGQKAIVEITADHFRVIPVDDSVRAQSDQIVLIELDAAPCPMVRGCETERPCKRYGGPYGSRAMAAAGYWFQQRGVAISRMGCSICEAGNTPFPHTDIDGRTMHANASRHGTATRVDLERVAQLNAATSISPWEKAGDDAE